MTTPLLYPPVSADDVCVAVEHTLLEHIQQVLDALEASGRVKLEPVRALEQVPNVDVLEKAELPAIAVSSPGLAEPPRRDEGYYHAKWVVDVGAFVRAEDFSQTQRATRDYALAIRLTVLTWASLGGIAKTLDWVDEAYNRISAENSSRTIGGALVTFHIGVGGVVNLRNPITIDDPHGQGIPVTAVDLSAVHEPLSG